MNAKQLERASYLAAHAILSANTSAPHLATPGARRSYTIDVIADKIKNVFELHCSALDESADWLRETAASRRSAAAISDSAETLLRTGVSSQKLQLIAQEVH